MPLSAFDNKFKQPKDNEVSIVLKETKQLWLELKEYFKEKYKNITEEWKYYVKSSCRN
jgi:hypothetical protein